MKLGKLKLSTVIAAGAMAFSLSASAAVIDNTTITGSIAPFGQPNTATYGQTFTVGADNVLNSFSLFLNKNGSEINLRGYVGAWDGAKVSSILFSSGTMAMTAGTGVAEFDFNTGALDLTTGSKYVLFLSVSDLGGQNAATFTMPTTGNSFAGGDFVFYNNGSNFSALSTNSWDCTECGRGDVAFKAQLSAASEVPEPASLALLGLGLMGLVAARRKA